MPATIVEKLDSRERSGGNATLRYTAMGSASDAAVLAALLATAPAYHDGLKRIENPAAKAIWVDDVKDDGLWECEVGYEYSPILPIGVQTITSSTTGGTQSIQCGLATPHKYAIADHTAPDMYNLIGASPDGAPTGCDIIVPVFNFRVKKVYAGKPNLSTIYTLTGKVNSGTFTATDNVSGQSIVLNAGECLFRGAECGEPRPQDGAVEVSYDFAGSPNRSDLYVGSIGPITKRGWDYLWVYYSSGPLADGERKITAPKPLYVYVNQVYVMASLSGLGIV